MKNNKNTSLTVPDLINTGVFTAVYFVLAAVATFGSAFLIPGYSYVFLPAIAALISGTVYMLLAAKVQKFGAITIMGMVMGIYFMISGHFILSFAANIIFGILADLMAKSCAYKKKSVLLASYVVFSYGLTGPVLPMWFMRNAYIANLEARGKSAEYIAAMFEHMTTATFFICVISILICAVIGGLFGQKMIRKHFAKAGIV